MDRVKRDVGHVSVMLSVHHYELVDVLKIRADPLLSYPIIEVSEEKVSRGSVRYPAGHMTWKDELAVAPTHCDLKEVSLNISATKSNFTYSLVVNVNIVPFGICEEVLRRCSMHKRHAGRTFIGPQVYAQNSTSTDYVYNVFVPSTV